MSFIKIDDNSDFPIDNLPYGVFTTHNCNDPHIGVAIGNFIVDLNIVSSSFPSDLAQAFQQPNLNEFLKLGHDKWSQARTQLQSMLKNDSDLSKDAVQQSKCLIKQSDAIMHLPIVIGDYTDFYSSIEHAMNVGKMFRDPNNPLLPNWRHLPVGYHGRASSVVISSTKIVRPVGQTSPLPQEDRPNFGPSKALDYELEIAFIAGPGNKLGQPIPISEAHKHIFGVVLMNDWSARDIQKWEYVPLGPFLAKNFATTISPWIVTMEALMPYVVENQKQEPVPHNYLQHVDPFTFDVDLQVFIRPNGSVTNETLVCHSNMKHLYWTMKQQLSHHSITGCNIRPGDLFGSGTISGPAKESVGSMLELTKSGAEPVTLKDGSTRKYLQDGDEVVFRGFTTQKNKSRIGFGECTGIVLPSSYLA
ncbi:hypothetical protein Ciccas_000582 [Cichlidogyrus casuarinus]|uniref:Fumarylacetoacetase n=1 Tax=Cichlidogyrus casuarinus TaxID=1844966 RepID=A0ABD2QMI8_9PLAT